MMKILLIGAEGRMGKAVTALSPNVMKATKRDDIIPLLSKCDVVLDFSTATAVQQHIPLINKPWVIGVTALDPAPLIEAAKKIPIFHSANFSYGIALLKKLLKQLPEGTYELTDIHHAQKKDSPSGTALDLASNLPSPVNIKSYREGTIIGEHTITLSLPFEKLELRHEVTDRNVFAAGALRACSFLVDKPAGYYTSIYD